MRAHQPQRNCSTQDGLIWTQPKSEKIHFTNSISRPQKKRKAQPGAEAASADACANGFYVSLDPQKKTFKKLGFGLGPDLTITDNFNFNMIQEKKFMNIKYLMNL
jgi:hypothetical protein